METLQLRSNDDREQCLWSCANLDGATCNSCLAVGTQGTDRSELRKAGQLISDQRRSSKTCGQQLCDQGFLLTMALAQHSGKGSFTDAGRFPGATTTSCNVWCCAAAVLDFSSSCSLAWRRNLLNTSSAPLLLLLTGWSQRLHDISSNYPGT